LVGLSTETFLRGPTSSGPPATDSDDYAVPEVTREAYISTEHAQALY